jgi:hypothetical protein
MRVRTSIIAAAAIWFWLTPFGAAVEKPPTILETETSRQTKSYNQKIEGYLYLDTEGQPLPIQTDTEIEAFLTKAEIVEEVQLPTGITNPMKLTLRADDIEVHAGFNDADISRRKVTEIINGRSFFSLDWHDSYRYSIAAYRLDRLLGLFRVPPVVPRQVKRAQGAVSIWLANTVTENERHNKLKVEPPNSRRWNQQRLLLQIFDDLVANRDSNLSNLLIDTNWRLWFIDCTRCFGQTKTLYYPLENIGQCERGMWQGLRELSEAEIREYLAPYLNKAEITALLVRRDKIIRHFERLIAARGETAVLYDIEPPSKTAPWAGNGNGAGVR